jgi:hypothetical protein
MEGKKPSQDISYTTKYTMTGTRMDRVENNEDTPMATQTRPLIGKKETQYEDEPWVRNPMKLWPTRDGGEVAR